MTGDPDPPRSTTPGSAEPQLGEKPGSAEPQLGEKPGSAEPQLGEKPGSAEPQLGEKPGNAEPQLGEKPGSAEPQLGEKPGSAEPQLGENSPWRSRGYLPHFDQPGTLQSITFRLADSLPKSLLTQLQEDLPNLPDSTHRQKVETYLDAGHGCCALRHPEVASAVESTLQKFDTERYHLLAWCIMPNHVHVLIEPKTSLAKIVQSWKSYTGRWAIKHNGRLSLNITTKAFWQREYWDRFIRDADHLAATINYIHQNPVTAKLCKSPEDYPHSSARLLPTNPTSASPRER